MIVDNCKSICLIIGKLTNAKKKKKNKKKTREERSRKNSKITPAPNNW